MERLTTVTGSASAIAVAVSLAIDVLDQDPQAQAASQGAPVERTLRCVVSNNEVGRVIGKGGASVSKIRESTGATIKMDSGEFGAVDRIMTVGGAKEATLGAMTQILEIVAAMPPSQPGGPPKRQAVSAPTGYPGYAAAPGYGQPPAAAYSPYGHPQPAYGQQPYAAPYAAYGQQPTPYQQAPATPLDIPAAELVQFVSQDGAGRMIGKQGAGIKELRSMYPRVHIRIETEAEPGSEYRKVTVTGPLEELPAAIGGIAQKLRS